MFYDGRANGQCVLGDFDNGSGRTARAAVDIATIGHCVSTRPRDGESCTTGLVARKTSSSSRHEFRIAEVTPAARLHDPPSYDPRDHAEVRRFKNKKIVYIYVCACSEPDKRSERTNAATATRFVSGPVSRFISNAI